MGCRHAFFLATRRTSALPVRRPCSTGWTAHAGPHREQLGPHRHAVPGDAGDQPPGRSRPSSACASTPPRTLPHCPPRRPTPVAGPSTRHGDLVARRSWAAWRPSDEPRRAASRRSADAGVARDQWSRRGPRPESAPRPRVRGLNAPAYLMGMDETSIETYSIPDHWSARRLYFLGMRGNSSSVSAGVFGTLPPHCIWSCQDSQEVPELNPRHWWCKHRRGL